MTRELQALHLFVFFLALLWVLPAPAATLTDRVVRVVDGDTLVVLSEGQLHRGSGCWALASGLSRRRSEGGSPGR